ncbi:MAG TPA: glycosyltransferase [Methylomirabilota bacterium]|jgi:glycosyltransferase involved in cell wall biosynthesis
MSALVSVIMPARNADAWLEESLGSILRQTYPRFEVIVVDDGSTDRTGALLAAVSDSRVTVLSQPPAGLTVSLNRGLARAKGEMVARMDADDVAMPERFARQIAFLEAHPDIGVVGTGCLEMGPTGEVVRVVRPPERDPAIRRALIRENPFVHASVMMRRGVLDRVGGYDERFAVAQDYDLWMRLSATTQLANIPEPLLIRRLVPGRVSATRDRERLTAEARVRWRAVASGAYAPWCAIFALRSVLALAVPLPLRRALRRARGR